MEELRDARGMTEAEAIARYRSRNYPKPALTADIVVFSRAGEGLKVLLIRRKGHPFITKLALPGGFANENEPVEITAARELEEETGYLILDVRTPEEFTAGHIPGAINIPNETIGSEAPALLPDKNQRILVYCRSGNRSKQASEKLAALGYTNITEFGGINTWPGETVTD